MRRGYNPNRKQRIFFKTNNQIVAREFRVIDEAGKQIGILEKNAALTLAQEKGLDLVEIGPNAKPPVVKLIDYKKFLYQQNKKRKEEKKGKKESDTKEIRLGLFIDNHDLDTKLKRSEEFIKKGNKLKIVVKFSGREITKKDIGQKLLKEVARKLESIAKTEKDIFMEGRQMIMILSKLK